MDSYNSQLGSRQYEDFTNSESGQFQQKILLDYILASLDRNPKQKILDAGCGSGWLTHALAGLFADVCGCDASAELIAYAKNKYPKQEFLVCDLTANLPFEKNSVDAIVANMSLHDMDNVPQALENFKLITKPGGKLVITISNPYYSLPVGVWKRGILGRLLLKKPKLLLRPYFYFKNKTDRKFGWGDNITSHFYSLAEYINWAVDNGFALTQMREIQAKTDSPNFNLQYQLYRFPYILLLEFKKSNFIK